MQLGAFSFGGETSGVAGFDSRFHFLLDAKYENIFNPSGEEVRYQTSSGFPARMPNDLRGLSGCSVWKIGDARTPVAKWDAKKARLVGVLTSVYANPPTIKATKWNVASTLPWSAFPDLRPAFDLHGEMRA